MCCFTLPKQWRPGLKVNVQSTHWPKNDAKGDLPEIRHLYTVEVPSYPPGSVGDLWVLRTAEGDIEVVVSNVEPGHAQWPGKVKGWPEPTLAYRRERWDVYRKLAENNVKLFRKLLAKFETNGEVDLTEAWELDKKYEPEVARKYVGPNDPAYREYKRKLYVEGLNYSKAELDEIMKGKP